MDKRSSKLTEEERIIYITFGIGHNRAEKISKLIGLGDPKNAFSLGFQQAFKMLLDKKVLTVAKIDDFIEEITNEL
jgi:hypothetical protein